MSSPENIDYGGESKLLSPTEENQKENICHAEEEQASLIVNKSISETSSNVSVENLGESTGASPTALHDENTPLLHPPTGDVVERIPTKKLIWICMKHLFWIVVSAFPTIIIVCLAGYGYSKLPWTRDIKRMNSTGEVLPVDFYFNRTVMFWFDDVMRTVSAVFFLSSSIF